MRGYNQHIVLFFIFLCVTILFSGAVLAQNRAQQASDHPAYQCRQQGDDFNFNEETEACYRFEEGHILWQGFSHEWDKTPHRLNRFGSYFKKIRYEANDPEMGGVLKGKRRSIFQVGAYNDTGLVSIKGQAFKSGVLGVYNDYVDEDCLKVSSKMGQAESVVCEVFVDLEQIGLKDYDQVTVLLRGFQLSATSYDKGYNTRGFTARVIPKERRDGVFHFDARFMVHPEHSPDRPSFDDGCLHDNHCDQYEYGARLYYVILGVNHDDGAFVNAKPTGTNVYKQDITMYPFKTVPWADRELRRASLEGVPGFEQAMVGIQGFSWHLKNWDKTINDGRYIRKLQFSVAEVDYDAETGIADFNTNMYFSNTGAWPYGFEVTFTMWNTLIQFKDEQYQMNNPSWYKGEIKKGKSSYTRKMEFVF